MGPKKKILTGAALASHTAKIRRMASSMDSEDGATSVLEDVRCSEASSSGLGEKSGVREKKTKEVRGVALANKLRKEQRDEAKKSDATSSTSHGSNSILPSVDVEKTA
uniref:Uncharacterized protein n=1 Tax=Photinus pyralis TaxID=7054 RepID=A0A1Y1MJ27_PHOPY